MTDLSSLKINKDRSPAPSSPPILKYGLIAAAVIVVLALGLAAMNIFGGEVAVTTATATTMTPQGATAVGALTASGYVVPQRKAAIASKATGRLVWLGVKEGDQVKEGQEIARLEDADVRARLIQAQGNEASSRAKQFEAESNLSLSNLSFKRQRDLFDSGASAREVMDRAQTEQAVSKSRLESAKADLAAARAFVQVSRVEFDNTRIRAPFSGTILTKGADLGEVVSPTSGSATTKGAVVTLADMTSLEVEADVSEANIARVQVGQPCAVTLDAYPSVKFEGAVSAIVPTANRNKATVLTKVRFVKLDSRVLPEMSAKVSFLATPTEVQKTGVDTVPRLVVPLSALTTINGKRSVFKIDNARAKAVEVETGAGIGNFIEVKRGLEPSAIVVSPVPKGLSDGAKVSVQNSK
ncbi:MAG: efflux RND transporter periplasmic adaptor subunit [Rhizobacter sp.]|nr:efflux RND transporter periplasmic adaptor subunit [Chlorobiales bacterium]